MAAGNDVKSYHSTTTSTTEEQVLLTQNWDRIEITNKDDTDYAYVRFDNTAAVAAAKGTQVVPPGGAKVFGPADGIGNPLGVPGSITAATACHRINIIGNATPYSIEGVAGA